MGHVTPGFAAKDLKSETFALETPEWILELEDLKDLKERIAQQQCKWGLQVFIAAEKRCQKRAQTKLILSAIILGTEVRLLHYMPDLIVLGMLGN